MKQTKQILLGLVFASAAALLMQLNAWIPALPPVVGQAGAFAVAGVAMWRVFKRPPAGWFLAGFVGGILVAMLVNLL